MCNLLVKEKCVMCIERKLNKQHEMSDTIDTSPITSEIEEERESFFSARNENIEEYIPIVK